MRDFFFIFFYLRASVVTCVGGSSLEKRWAGLLLHLESQILQRLLLLLRVGWEGQDFRGKALHLPRLRHGIDPMAPVCSLSFMPSPA